MGMNSLNVISDSLTYDPSLISFSILAAASCAAFLVGNPPLTFCSLAPVTGLFPNSTVYCQVFPRFLKLAIYLAPFINGFRQHFTLIHLQSSKCKIFLYIKKGHYFMSVHLL